jgi:hypothetical protein
LIPDAYIEIGTGSQRLPSFSGLIGESEPQLATALPNVLDSRLHGVTAERSVIKIERNQKGQPPEFEGGLFGRGGSATCGNRYYNTVHISV